MKLVAQRFKSLLNCNPELHPLLHQAQTLSALHRHFTSVAPPYLVQSSQVLCLQSGILNIAAANAAVAAKLRQLAPELVVMLQDRGCEVSGIRVKVQVSFQHSTAPAVPRKLGKTARDALDELGRTLGDSPLKLALKKLAKTRE